MESKIVHVNTADFDTLTPEEHEAHHKMTVNKLSENGHDHDDIWGAIHVLEGAVYELKERLPKEGF